MTVLLYRVLNFSYTRSSEQCIIIHTQHSINCGVNLIQHCPYMYVFVCLWQTILMYHKHCSCTLHIHCHGNHCMLFILYTAAGLPVPSSVIVGVTVSIVLILAVIVVVVLLVYFKQRAGKQLQ